MTTGTERLLGELRRTLRDGGLYGSFLVRDLETGDEIGIDPDIELPVASLVKIPLALVTLERIRRGELDGAADALFALTPPDRVGAVLHEFGLRGIAVRHTMRELMETPVERFDPADVHLAHALAIDAGTPGRGHRVPQLDVSRANTGTARAFVDLLQALWRSRPGTEGAEPPAIHPDVAARVRGFMANNLVRNRLGPDFDSDSSTWSSKTGMLLNLRHEVGVVEHADGQTYAVAVLTESRVAAGRQPGADALMGQVARRLRDELRSRWV
ncbi:MULTISPECIES: serine hydrolase [unclassified Streptomyces]|uniref:serine hydrolase n=1 Tax=unclassified Streptomyces TaxID=2593676 RepID=UPI0004C0D430|nr:MULTISPECIES: serine hydrolase [unclassified Streptomyces]